MTWSDALASLAIGAGLVYVWELERRERRRLETEALVVSHLSEHRATA